MTPEQANKIKDLALSSSAASYPWKKRGRAPRGYTVGMALSYARCCERLKERHPAMMAAADRNLGPPTRDALSHYALTFKAHSWDLTQHTLRCLFALLFGLGMRESSGRYCEGRDRSASNTTATTAEAGLFQTSWNISSTNPIIKTVLEELINDAKFDGFLSEYRDGVSCSVRDFSSYGSGIGRTFQDMQRKKPHLAVEVALIGLRTLRRHWGPINRHEAEVRPEVMSLLISIEKVI